MTDMARSGDGGGIDWRPDVEWKWGSVADDVPVESELRLAGRTPSHATPARASITGRTTPRTHWHGGRTSRCPSASRTAPVTMSSSGPPRPGRSTRRCPPHHTASGQPSAAPTTPGSASTACLRRWRRTSHWCRSPAYRSSVANRCRPSATTRLTLRGHPMARWTSAPASPGRPRGARGMDRPGRPRGLVHVLPGGGRPPPRGERHPSPAAALPGGARSGLHLRDHGPRRWQEPPHGSPPARMPMAC